MNSAVANYAPKSTIRMTFVGHLVERFFARDPANTKVIRMVLFGALCVVSLAIAVGAVAAEMYPGI